MKQQRLDGLADGIFAIVMTLLAFEIQVPPFDRAGGDLVLWQSLFAEAGVFASFILSFALLFTYWRAHHFLTSVYAKNLTVGLANYNAVFFLLVTLVPFSSKLLGSYKEVPTAIFIYGVNVILIGMTLYSMRRYIELSPKVEALDTPQDEKVSGYVRILFPVFTAVVAIAISLFSPHVSIIFFIVAILFNLAPASTNFIHEAIVRRHKD